MRILILGGLGTLGHRLWLELGKKHEVWASLRGTASRLPEELAFNMDRVCERIDVMKVDSVIRAFTKARPDLVINCVGLIKQLPEANDPLLAIQINTEFPHRLAHLCAARECRMIHISTDCVFSGRKGDYTETDVSDAEDLYGRSKYLGEVAYPHTVTLRTSFIGHELNSKLGLLEWFLNQTQGVKGYRKAIFSGLTTHELARVMLEYVIPRSDLSGVYHVSSQAISKYDLLHLLNRAYQLGLDIEPDDQVVCDRSLDSSRFRQLTGYTPPTWEEMVETMAADAPLYR